MFIKTFSPSKYNTYKECPLKYRYRYIDYLKDDYNATLSTDALQFGSYIHKILEDGVNATSIEELREIGKGLRKNYKFKGRIKDTETCIRNFFEFNSNLEGSISTEMIFSEQVIDDLSVNGIIDRVCKSKSGKYLVIDYKTSKREKTKRELQTDPQLMTYAAAIAKMYNVPVQNVSVSHYYPLTGNLVALRYLPPQISSFLRKLNQDKWVIRKAKVSDFKPQVNQYCNWCGYKDICPKQGACPEKINEALKKSKFGHGKPKGNKG
tara:strand:+ start:232 stop:1026 length:795 start_codon:yes stop_codon:yes gene_type:complete